MFHGILWLNMGNTKPTQRINQTTTRNLSTTLHYTHNGGMNYESQLGMD